MFSLVVHVRPGFGYSMSCYFKDAIASRNAMQAALRYEKDCLAAHTIVVKQNDIEIETWYRTSLVRWARANKQR